jgi:hypothetical protein
MAVWGLHQPARAQTGPALVWITNSSVKLEQLLGDVDWATGSNTTSQTVSRFNIEGTDVGSPFESGTNLIILFGDTVGANVDYHAADCFAWSTNTDGETGLLLNFFTKNGTNLFVQPPGIKMGPDDVPNAGITISNVIYLICSTGANAAATNQDQVHSNSITVLVTFDQTNLTFQTNRVVTVVTNGGHFLSTSLHLYGTNVLMFGEGNYRNSDIYLASIPAASFLSGAGSIYFTGLTNGQPTWSSVESNAVPVVQDNPTNGPAWPCDTPSVGAMSAVYSPALGLWLMTFDGGRHTSDKTATVGVYFCYAAQPWGPWSTPQLIFNATRDNGFGNFMFNRHYPTNPVPFTVAPSNNIPTNTDGAVYAPHVIERFIRVTNSTLLLYYTMSTWNPYTVVKMRSAFAIVPRIDSSSLVHKKNKFSFAWYAPTNASYQVQYASNLISSWLTFTNVISSASGTFTFTNDETGGLPPIRFYRLKSAP